MPFLGKHPDHTKKVKYNCANPRGPHQNLCKKPYWFMWLIPEYTVWKCKTCGRTYYLDKHLTDTGGDYFTKWLEMEEYKPHDHSKPARPEPETHRHDHQH